MVSAFEGNKAETKTMLPVIEPFMAAHDLPDVTVVADAGMVSEANQEQIEAAGLSFILGMKIPHVPYAVAQWWREHPGQDIPDGHVFTQPWPAGLAGGTRSVNRELEEKARSLAGLKGYVTNLPACPDETAVTAEFMIGAYHQLFQIEKSFRMAKSDLQARPIYHRTRDSIEAHLTIVFAALAVSRWIEHQTGWSMRRFVKTARRYRTVQIQAGPHTVTAADPLPDDLRQVLEAINHANRPAHQIEPTRVLLARLSPCALPV
jgi:hypothetical protein